MNFTPCFVLFLRCVLFNNAGCNQGDWLHRNRQEKEKKYGPARWRWRVFVIRCHVGVHCGNRKWFIFSRIWVTKKKKVGTGFGPKSRCQSQLQDSRIYLGQSKESTWKSRQRSNQNSRNQLKNTQTHKQSKRKKANEDQNEEPNTQVTMLGKHEEKHGETTWSGIKREYLRGLMCREGR